jgi:hypothetical protein
MNPVRDPSANDMRPFFLDLWKQYHFDTATLAGLADVAEDEVLAMLRFQPVSRAIAEGVLAIVSDAFPEEGYTLSSVKVNLSPPPCTIEGILNETSSYAINPEFKDSLQKTLLRQFKEQEKRI